MKFIYLFCVSLLIFSKATADEEYNYDDDLDDGIYPREYYSVSHPVIEPEILPSHPTYDYPVYNYEVSTSPSLKDKVDQAKKKIAETKKKVEKELKDKMEALKQKKVKKFVKKPKITKAKPEPVVLYNRVPKKPEILPPHPSYGYPVNNYEEVTTIPSLINKFDQAKEKIDQTKKKLEKELKDKMETLKQKKLKKIVKPKITTTTPEPVILYNRVPKRIVKVNKMKKPKKSKKCILIYKVLFG